MNFEILVDADRFWPRLKADIEAAKKSIYIQVMTFEGDRAGRQVADALLRAKAPDKRVLVDTVSLYMVSDHFIYKPANWFDEELWQERRATLEMINDFERHGVCVKLTNPYGPLWLRSIARNHKKLMVIDGEIAYMGGINFSDHNFAWHDMMLRIENREVAAFLQEDFLSTWQGLAQSVSRSLTNIELWVGDGRSNPRIFREIFEILRNAKKEIFIESTYFTLPFFDQLRAINRPGLQMTLITSEVNNWRALKNYIPWDAKRSGVHLRFYPRRLTHLKTILVDDRFLILGSSNFEFFSYYLYQEILAIISDARLIGDFREKVMNPDLLQSIPYQGRYFPLRSFVRSLQFRALGKISRLVTFL